MMKKFLAFFLAMIMLLSFAGCGKTMCSVEGCENEAVEDTTYEESLCDKHLTGKKAFDASKIAYDSIDVAYEITEQYGSDVYEAWRMGIYDKDEILDDDVAYLASELSLSEEDIKLGVAYTVSELMGQDWETLTEESKKAYCAEADLYFYLMEDDLFTFCVMVVSNAYKVNGKVDEAKTALDEAKAQMKELSDKYSDYEHYPNLKGYYTTTSSFFDFCQNPTGSFEQVKDTINDYKNEARDYISDLDYIFEE
ncbi:MAG: hypothetical protein IJE28_05490 [Oscillospiraceae bacterium]|nr:hypothetical protein [Oscillospiraceae bacterium]MBQ3500869.1 hypothetical protein [Oscillospiraceae bacterium]MBQ4643265.1 hypothetical protein [Oscillospiraceae bacterium]